MNTATKLQGVKKSARSPVDRDDFQRLLREADSEWEGILRFGRYCGFSLASCVQLRWQHVTRDRKALALPRRSGDAVLHIPLGPQLTQYLLSLPTKPPQEAPLFPRGFSTSVDELKAKFATLSGNTLAHKKGEQMSFEDLHYHFRR
jgi:integrase